MGAYIARPRCRLDTRFAPIRVNSGVSLRCARFIQVHTYHYLRLEKLTTPLATSRKTTTYIFHVVSITTHTHDRHKSIAKEKRKTRKEDKGKGRGDKKKKKKEKEKTQEKSKKRQDNKRKQGKGKKKIVILADPRK